MTDEANPDIATSDSEEKKQRKKPERKRMYVLVPISNDDDAPYRLSIVKSRDEVRKVLEAAHVDGRTPTAMARVIVLRAQQVTLKMNTQVVFRF